MSRREASARAIGIATLVLVSAGCTAPVAEVSQMTGISAEASFSSDTDPTALPTPTQSPAPTDTPAPTEPPSDGTDIFEVVTTDLVMRSEPGTGPESEIYSPSLSAPMLLNLLSFFNSTVSASSASSGPLPRPSSRSRSGARAQAAVDESASSVNRASDEPLEAVVGM